MKPTPSAYLPALDGLRALAVAAVFAYHLSLPLFRGGFLGVDLFFVISGFLITTLLVTEAQRTNRVRITAFWMRRVRRLMPALVLMVVVVSAAALLIGRDLDAGLRLQVLGAAVYGSNWVQIASGASYVEHFEPSLLTHLWSLGVEEQFYLIWPFVVVVLISFLVRRRSRVLAVCLLAGASAAWMAVAFVPGADPTRAYVGTDTHGFGLLLGAALGFGLPLRRRSDSPGRAARLSARPGLLSAVGIIGYMVVLAGMLLLTDQGTATFRGGIVLVDVAAVGLVAAAARGAGPVGAVFALPAADLDRPPLLRHLPLALAGDRHRGAPAAPRHRPPGTGDDRRPRHHGRDGGLLAAGRGTHPHRRLPQVDRAIDLPHSRAGAHPTVAAQPGLAGYRCVRRGVRAGRVRRRDLSADVGAGRPVGRR